MKKLSMLLFCVLFLTACGRPELPPEPFINQEADPLPGQSIFDEIVSDDDPLPIEGLPFEDRQPPQGGECRTLCQQLSDFLETLRSEREILQEWADQAQQEQDDYYDSYIAGTNEDADTSDELFEGMHRLEEKKKARQRIVESKDLEIQIILNRIENECTCPNPDEEPVGVLPGTIPEGFELVNPGTITIDENAGTVEFGGFDRAE